MPRRKSETLTDGELRLMRVLWDRKHASVGDVVAALPPNGRPAYNTVLTLLRILEDKGYIRHEKEGRAFVYSPVVDRRQAQRRAVRRLVRELFDGSPGSLAVNILEHDEVDAGELAQLRELIDVEDRG